MSDAAGLPEHELIGTAALTGFGPRDGLLWGAAFAVVLLAQAAGVFALSSWRSDPDPAGAPPPAMVIELATVPVAPQVEQLAAEVSQEVLAPEPVDPLEPLEPAEASPEPLASEPVEVAEAVEPLPPPLESVEPTAPAPIEPAEPTALAPEALEPLPQAAELEKLVPDLVPSESAEVYLPMPLARPDSLAAKRQQFAAAQQPDPAPEAEPKPPRKQQPPPARKKARPAESTSVEARDSRKVAAKEKSVAAERAPKVSPQKWKSQVVARLSGLARSAARKMGQRYGTPSVRFTVDGRGRVTSVGLARSSGDPALDKAALQLVRSASPLPAPPDPAGYNLTLDVPIRPK